MRIIATLAILLFSISNSIAKTVNILQYGAVNDGRTSNTEIIKRTIEALSKNGGGTIYFPTGTYLTGPIVLKSNITLDIDAGATIKFTDNFAEYTPFVEMRYEGVVMKSFCPMIYAYEQENITIKGEGTIDGNGKKWWYGTFTIEGYHKDDEFKNELAKYQEMWSKENPNFKVEEQSDWKRTLAKRFFRPPLIQPYKCKNVKIEGVKIINSPFWTINPEFCENVSILSVNINNPDAPNTDGINPSSCKNVVIANSIITVGDDCITLKSGRDLQGREYATPCENITITNCVMRAGHGGVVIGSEMSGDVKKVTISNCVFDGTDRGIRIKSTRGRGGIVEDIRVSNIVMKNIAYEAITMNLFYSKIPVEQFSDRTPIFRNIHINGLTGSEVKTACTILGIEESPIYNISLTDINIDAQEGLQIDKGKDITLNNVMISTERGAAFKVSDSQDIYANNIGNTAPLSDKAIIEVSNVKDMFVSGCFPRSGSSSFMNIEGQNTENIILKNNAFNRLKSIVEKSSDLNPSAIIIE